MLDNFEFFTFSVFCESFAWPVANLLPAAFYSGKIGNEFIISVVAALIWNLEKCISNEEISNQADL